MHPRLFTRVAVVLTGAEHRNEVETGRRLPGDNLTL
jgi:hypothetical protein